MRTERGLSNGLGRRISFNCKRSNITLNQRLPSPNCRSQKILEQGNFASLMIHLTLDELAAESVADGAKPSKTETAAPTSGSNTESTCENEK